MKPFIVHLHQVTVASGSNEKTGNLPRPDVAFAGASDRHLWRGDVGRRCVLGAADKEAADTLGLFSHDLARRLASHIDSITDWESGFSPSNCQARAEPIDQDFSRWFSTRGVLPELGDERIEERGSMLNYLLGCICTRLKAPFGRVAKCRLVDFVDGCLCWRADETSKGEAVEGGDAVERTSSCHFRGNWLQIRDENVLN